MYNNSGADEAYYQIVEKLDKEDLVNGLLYALSIGTVTATMLAAPNAMQMLEKPLAKFLDGMDERQKRRKISKLKSYMKTCGLVQGDYDHGIKLTKKARKRIQKINIDSVDISPMKNWDHKWRIIMFDIPETQRESRKFLIHKAKDMGMQLLQRSVWIHPYPFKDEITIIANHLGVNKWITYIEISHIDNEELLIKRFPGLQS